MPNMLQIFLSPFAPERLLSSDLYRRPNTECAVCSPVQTRVAVDLSRATLKDLVEDVLRLQLGYGEEFAVNSDIGTLYDVEEEDNLVRKLSELGMSIPISVQNLN
jgi:ubiquitin-like 1-activating enzyme E1 B